LPLIWTDPELILRLRFGIAQCFVPGISGLIPPLIESM